MIARLGIGQRLIVMDGGGGGDSRAAIGMVKASLMRCLQCERRSQPDVQGLAVVLIKSGKGLFTMLGMIDGSDRVRLAAARHFEGERYDGWHKLLPVLLGAMLPMLWPVLVEPASMLPALPVMHAALIVMAVIAVAVAAYSTLHKGDVVSVTLDPARGQLLLVHSGPLANVGKRLPLASVARLEMATVLIDGRQRRQVPQLVTNNGRAYMLPADISRTELVSFRAAIADAVKRRAGEKR